MAQRTSIDLNADLGEGLAFDRALLPLLTSANVACGFHAGDPATMRSTVTAAAAVGVAVGAHPGYPDRSGFGRRDLAASADEIIDDVLYQIGALAAICRACGTSLRYVKPHGALYNRATRDPVAAGAVAEAVRLADPSLVLLGLAHSAMITAGRDAGLAVAAEGFADRAYAADGTLVPREVPGSVIVDPKEVAARAVAMARARTVDSLCVHGDTPGALALVQAIRVALDAEGIAVRSFVGAAR
jgi:5-oxoprolinase (ATP-hydrolysing) subunit A